MNFRCRCWFSRQESGEGLKGENDGRSGGMGKCLSFVLLFRCYKEEKKNMNLFFVLKNKTPLIMICTNKSSCMHNSVFYFDFHCSGSMILEVLKILVNNFSGERRMRNFLSLLPQR